MKDIKRIPKIGEVVPFFDDGKVCSSRLYKAIIKDVALYVYAPDYVKQAFKTNSEVCSWIWNGTTDYFIGCVIKEYDENDIWFARTKEGGWFSLDIQSDWQGGVLDVDGELKKVLDSNRRNP